MKSHAQAGPCYTEFVYRGYGRFWLLNFGQQNTVSGSTRYRYTEAVRAMSSKQFVVQPGDRRAALSVIGTSVTVLVPVPEGKSQQVTLQSGDEGTGPPPHSHDWDESFYVTQGQVQFTCAGRSTMCVAGTFVHVPAGVVHAFNYGPGGGEMLEITGTGSKAIQMFTALDREIPPGPPDVQKVVQVAGEHGVTFHI